MLLSHPQRWLLSTSCPNFAVIAWPAYFVSNNQRNDANFILSFQKPVIANCRWVNTSEDCDCGTGINKWIYSWRVIDWQARNRSEDFENNQFMFRPKHAWTYKHKSSGINTKLGGIDQEKASRLGQWTCSKEDIVFHDPSQNFITEWWHKRSLLADRYHCSSVTTLTCYSLEYAASLCLDTGQQNRTRLLRTKLKNAILHTYLINEFISQRHQYEGRASS